MHQNHVNETYTLFFWKNGTWTVREVFASWEELLSYLAQSHADEEYFRKSAWYGYSRARRDGYDGSVLDNLNFTGKDTRIVTRECPDFSLETVRVLRRYMIRDSRGRIVDPRRDRKKNLRAGGSYAGGAVGGNRGKNRRGTIRFRKDPVPGTGRWRRHRGCSRTVKHWFGSYRQDHIPEIRPYVRYKAIVEDPWDTEPWECFSRSWKDQTKCRHQWQHRGGHGEKR